MSAESVPNPAGEFTSSQQCFYFERKGGKEEDKKEGGMAGSG